MSWRRWKRWTPTSDCKRLPDGLNTYVSAGETTLGIETTYAIGIARALLHKPPIVLAMEPPPPAEHNRRRSLSGGAAPPGGIGDLGGDFAQATADLAYRGSCRLVQRRPVGGRRTPRGNCLLAAIFTGISITCFSTRYRHQKLGALRRKSLPSSLSSGRDLSVCPPRSTRRLVQLSLRSNGRNGKNPYRGSRKNFNRLRLSRRSRRSPNVREGR